MQILLINSHMTCLLILKLNSKILRILQKFSRLTSIINFLISIKYFTLQISDMHKFQICCLVHEFIYDREKFPPAGRVYWTTLHLITLFMIIAPEDSMNYIKRFAIKYLDIIILKKRVLDCGILYQKNNSSGKLYQKLAPFSLIWLLTSIIIDVN